MAGSYNHAVNHGDRGNGELLCNEDMVQMIENGGDMFETVEEMYGMIWWLAATAADTAHSGPQLHEHRTRDLVEMARKNYQEGLRLSPGTDAHLPEEDE